MKPIQYHSEGIGCDETDYDNRESFKGLCVENTWPVLKISIVLFYGIYLNNEYKFW